MTNNFLSGWPHPLSHLLLQGMPDYPPPSFVLEALNKAAKVPSLHQYTRGMVKDIFSNLLPPSTSDPYFSNWQGHPRLVKALGKLYSKMLGRELDPMSNVSHFLVEWPTYSCWRACIQWLCITLQVLVTEGAYSALSHAINGFVQEGDEVRNSYALTRQVYEEFTVLRD